MSLRSRLNAQYKLLIQTTNRNIEEGRKWKDNKYFS